LSESFKAIAELLKENLEGGQTKLQILIQKHWFICSHHDRNLLIKTFSLLNKSLFENVIDFRFTECEHYTEDIIQTNYKWTTQNLHEFGWGLWWESSSLNHNWSLESCCGMYLLVCLVHCMSLLWWHVYCCHSKDFISS